MKKFLYLLSALVLSACAGENGENRWRAPQPVVTWEGVRMCDKFGHPAFQSMRR